MMDIRVKVRICMLLLALFCVQSAPPCRTSEDIKCLQLGTDYVYDKGIATCLRCTTCHCLYIDENPHCVKCVDYGIIDCYTSAPVTVSPHQRETTQLLSTTVGVSLQTAIPPQPMTIKPTIWKPQTITARPSGDSEDDSKWKVPLAVGLSFFGGIVFVVGLYKGRKYIFPKRISGPTIRQETQPHEDSVNMESLLENPNPEPDQGV